MSLTGVNKAAKGHLNRFPVFQSIVRRIPAEPENNAVIFSTFIILILLCCLQSDTL